MEDQYEQLLLSPITIAAPCGKLVVYEEDYEAVQHQISYLSSPDPSIISWRKVAEHCERILRDKSKDLTIACYWSIAQLELEGFQKFARSVELLKELISLYWEDMYPDKKRFRGRINALSWWLDRLEFRITNFCLKPTDKVSIEQAGKNIKEFELMLGTKCSEKLLKFSSVNQRLTTLMKAISVTENVNHNVASELVNTIDCVVKQSAGNAVSTSWIKDTPNHESVIDVLEPKSTVKPVVNTSSKSIEFCNEDDVTQSLRERQQELFRVSKYLLVKSSRDPRAYYLNRVAAWLTVKSSPIHRGDGVTPFQIVSSEQRGKILKFWDNREYEALVNLCEELVPLNPYYLDLHHYSAMSLMYMGDDYKQAKEVVEYELRGFLLRFPEMTKLMFKNGEPFVGNETKEWLSNQLLGGNNQSKSEKIKITDGQQCVEKSITKSKHISEYGADGIIVTDVTDINGGIDGISGTKSFEENIVFFQTALTRAKTKRDKFLIKLSQAEFCYKEGKYDIAISQLQHLRNQSETYYLEYWEQVLVVKMICLHLQSYISLLENRNSVGKDLSGEIDDLYYKLCQLDLVEATKFDTSKWRTPSIH